MPRPDSYRLNDATIELNEDGEVTILWDHGDEIHVYDGGGYLVVMVNGIKEMDGEFSRSLPTNEQKIADRIDGFDRDDLGESPDY